MVEKLRIRLWGYIPTKQSSVFKKYGAYQAVTLKINASI
jgi:hypothetical protein